MNESATLKSLKGQPVVLEQVDVRGEIHALYALVSMSQRYRNTDTEAIEAVYTFPLPLDAVLLGFDVEIGDRRLIGAVLPRRKAEEDYEEAIADGDSAMVLEQASLGLYTMSVGNLMPGEVAIIRLRYGQLLCWNGRLVRFMLPTTLAPRYGDPTVRHPHQAPAYSFDVERSLSLEVVVRGPLAGARYLSPSHAIDTKVGRTETIVRVTGTPPMDRDFVLEMRSEGDGSTAAVSTDRHGYVAVASFRPDLPQASIAPKTISIVVDCSGSMGGDSMTQAKVALERILDGLRRGDRFNIVAFGSDQKMLFDAPMWVGEATLELARSYVRNLDADMGGTEVGAALAATYAAAPRVKQDPSVTSFSSLFINVHNRDATPPARAGSKRFRRWQILLTLHGRTVGKYFRACRDAGIPCTRNNVELAMSKGLISLAPGPVGADEDRSNQLLLITDGEVWDWQRIVEDGRKSAHQIFTVGVGSAVAEAFLQSLASATGGSCELVSPREDMAERVHRHFQRMYSPSASAKVVWPAQPQRVYPESLGNVFHGDTVHCFAWFEREVTGRVAFEVRTADGSVTNHEAGIFPIARPGSDALSRSGDVCDEVEVLARLGAAKLLEAEDDEAAAESMAVEYQLMSRWTNFLVVHRRSGADKATQMPAFRPVGHIIVAGWCGTGSVACRSWGMLADLCEREAMEPRGGVSRMQFSPHDPSVRSDLISAPDAPGTESQLETEILELYRRVGGRAGAWAREAPLVAKSGFRILCGPPLVGRPMVVSLNPGRTSTDLWPAGWPEHMSYLAGASAFSQKMKGIFDLAGISLADINAGYVLLFRSGNITEWQSLVPPHVRAEAEELSLAVLRELVSCLRPPFMYVAGFSTFERMGCVAGAEESGLRLNGSTFTLLRYGRYCGVPVVASQHPSGARLSGDNIKQIARALRQIYDDFIGLEPAQPGISAPICGSPARPAPARGETRARSRQEIDPQL